MGHKYWQSFLLTKKLSHTHGHSSLEPPFYMLRYVGLDFDSENIGAVSDTPKHGVAEVVFRLLHPALHINLHLVPALLSSLLRKQIFVVFRKR